MMTILFHPVVPWLICAAIAAVCAWLIYDLEKQRKATAAWAKGCHAAYEAEIDAHEEALADAEERCQAAEEARDAYRKALAQARWRRQGGFDWRDSHLGTRVSDDNALTRVWEKPL